MRRVVAEAVVGIARVLAGGNVRRVGFTPDERQRIYFANHASHLDFVLIWAALPPRLRGMTRPVAARDYWDRPGLRRYLGVKVFNAVLVERQQPAQRGGVGATVGAQQSAIDILLDGLGDRHSLILFPEGTRGDGSTIGPFKSGLYRLGKARPDVELIPAYISNLNRVLPKGEFVPVPMLASVSFGEPMRVGEDEEKDAFLARARNAILELRQW
ncbi:MAG TPA: lysophospholipid acyltransferase family protein [Thermoanaerobaculia bacterium]|nr:lysophospholipid acyltransferase family protein [Thermoanaerobaculia bacterium]